MIDPANQWSNGNVSDAAPATQSDPAVEALLFKSGAISADQLGELVRDSVLTQRSVASIALERGFTTPQALAALQPVAAEMPCADVRPEQAVAAPSPPATVEHAVPMSAVPPALGPVSHLVQTVAVPLQAGTSGPQTVAGQPEPAVSPFPAMPPPSIDERVRAVVARAAPTPPVAVAPAAHPVAVAPAQQERMAVPERDFGAGATSQTATFGVLVRLQTGEQLAVQSASSFEDAVEQAQSLAGRFSRAGEWPFIAGRCIRPEAVVSIDIERSLER